MGSFFLSFSTLWCLGFVVSFYNQGINTRVVMIKKAFCGVAFGSFLVYLFVRDLVVLFVRV